MTHFICISDNCALVPIIKLTLSCAFHSHQHIAIQCIYSISVSPIRLSVFLHFLSLSVFCRYIYEFTCNCLTVAARYVVRIPFISSSSVYCCSSLAFDFFFFFVFQLKRSCARSIPKRKRKVYDAYSSSH